MTEPKNTQTKTQQVAHHRRRHQSLHMAINELLGDFVAECGLGLGCATLIDFVRWSFANTIEPTNDATWRHPQVGSTMLSSKSAALCVGVKINKTNKIKKEI